jgi:plasmid stability protein
MKMQTQLRLPEEIDLDLRVKAAQNRRSISDLAAEAIRYYLDNYETIKPKKQ